MTGISERVALGHRAEAYYDGTIACYCDPEPVYTADRFAEHIAEVTEAATRESIRVKLRDLPTTRTLAYLKGWDSVSLNDAIGSTL